MTRAVYPPDAVRDWPGKHLDWSEPQIDVLLFDESGALAAYAAVVVREALADTRRVVIGGVGGVKTHPQARGNGYGARVMREAERLWAERMVDFGLLVCEPGLIEFYTRLGWIVFAGTLLTLQGGESVPFLFNRVMLLAVNTEPPTEGVIDLKGPPW